MKVLLGGLLSLLIFTGCSTKVGIEQVMKLTISEDKQITRVISNKDELKSAEKQIFSLRLFNGKNSKTVWNKIKTDINLSKENILIHTVHQNGICKYDEKFIKKSFEQVDIMLMDSKNPNGICMYDLVNYYLIYRVSKNIKKVGIKAFNYDYVVVDMK